MFAISFLCVSVNVTYNNAKKIKYMLLNAYINVTDKVLFMFARTENKATRTILPRMFTAKYLYSSLH